MVQNWIFLCVFMTVIKPYATVSVTHVGYPINWLQTSGMCKKNGIEFEESVLRDSDILQGKMFWIGKAIYSKTSDWIEIIGCYEVTDTTRMKTITKITYLGECQIKCKSVLPLLQNNQPSYFGYNETSNVCVCDIYLPVDKIDILHCENKKSLNAYFFYKVYQKTVSEKQGAQEHCTVLKCLGGHNQLKAINCLSINQGGRCGNGEILQWGQAYNSYLNACKSKNQLLLAPSLYCKLGRYYNEGIEFWTNVFRKVYKVQLTEVEAKTEPLKCLAGELTNDSGKWTLHTLEMNCSVGFEWFLCREAKTQSFTVPTAVFPATSLLTFPKLRSGTASAPVFTTSASMKKTTMLRTTQIKETDMNKSPSTSNRSQKDEIRSTSKTGAVIGGLLGACSIIALIAVLIVCKVRSIGLYKQSPKHDKKESSQMQFSKAVYQDSNVPAEKKSTALSSNETYGLTENRTPVYAVVNKIKTPENVNDTYTDAAYGEYDHLHDIQNRKMCQQENLYHSHHSPQNEEDQTYDRSDFGKGKTHGGNGLYDQSISLVEEEYSYSTHTNLENTNDMGIYDKAS